MAVARLSFGCMNLREKLWSVMWTGEIQHCDPEVGTTMLWKLSKKDLTNTAKAVPPPSLNTISAVLDPPSLSDPNILQYPPGFTPLPIYEPQNYGIKSRLNPEKASAYPNISSLPPPTLPMGTGETSPRYLGGQQNNVVSHKLL